MDIDKRLDDIIDRDEALEAVRASFHAEGAEGTLPLEFAYAAALPDAEGFDPSAPGEYGPAYERFLARRAREALAASADRLEQGLRMAADGRVLVWRAIVVAEGWERKEAFERPLGVFWAFDPEFAVAHHGPSSKDMRTVTIEALVDPGYVDWQGTVVLNAIDEATVGEEREIRLLESAKVEILGGSGADLSGLVGVAMAVGAPVEAEADPEFHDGLHQAAGAANGFYGSRGAGCVVVARSTGRVLLALRSERVLEPGTYGIWGGAVDPGLSPEEAARREMRQESGLNYEGELAPLLVFSPEGSSFRYHNFLAVVDDEFEPALNEEHDLAVWASLDDLPAQLHFGVEALLADPASVEAISEAGRVAQATP